jgi:filamentous hemagglutinin family protein
MKKTLIPALLPVLLCACASEPKISQESISDNASILNGNTEVQGHEADLVIINPNGIKCDGCGFINAGKVKLVSGTSVEIIDSK